MQNFEVQQRQFGLIGYPLAHSFSKQYFSEQFQREGITDAVYDLYPLPDIREFPTLCHKHPNLKGLNVTIPYKQAVISYLEELDNEAAAVGAVNTISFKEGVKKGYNTDVFGFRVSLQNWLMDSKPMQALVLGNGGASKAVQYVLRQMGIAFQVVSRNPGHQDLSYDVLDDAIIQQHRLIINTTPLGMSPQVDTFPNLPYASLGKAHFCYDLVYNPSPTFFLQKASQQGAQVQNGLEMLHLQAERAWAIWNMS